MTWPNFGALWHAWWFLLIIPIVIVYFLKLKRPRLEVPSLALWQAVIDDQRVNSPFQKFRRNILLWLQLLLLCLLVLGAMKPIIPGRSTGANYLPILVDCSASMAATDEKTGKTRLELVKDQLREFIENITPEQQVSLIAMHSSAQRVCEFTSNKPVLLNALDKIEIHDVPSEIDNALRVTQALARTNPAIDTVAIYSDGNFPQRVNFELPFVLNYQLVAPAGPNIGITAFNARQGKPPNWTVFLRVEATSDSSGEIELYQDGELLDTDSFVLEKGQAQRLVFDVQADDVTHLEAKLAVDAGGYDSLPTDNTAHLDLPAARPLNVFVNKNLSNHIHALQAIDTISLFVSGDADETDVYDLVISDEAADPEADDDSDIEASTRFFVGVVPPDLKKVLQQRDGVSDFVDWERADLLLQHMQLRDITIGQDIQMAEGTTESYLEELGYLVLARGDKNVPLILQKRSGSQLTYYMLFHSDRSSMPYRVAFPVLLNNLIQVAFQEANILESHGPKTQLLPALELDRDKVYEVTGPTGETVEMKSNSDGILNGVPALKVGKYKVSGDGGSVAEVSVSLLNADETNLSTVEKIEFNELSVEAAQEALDTDQPLWPILATIAIVLLVLEWSYFQRRPAGAQA
jgi:Ca-activated chloride channel homolog